MVIENVAYVFGQLVIATCLAWSGYGVWALVAGNLSFRLIKLCGVVLYTPVGPGGGVFSFASAKALIDRGIGFSLGRILNFFSLQGDNFVVGRVLGADALGMYTRAYQLMSLPAMYVGQVFDRVLFPAVAREQGDAGRVRRSLLASLELVACISLPTAVVMFICAEEVIGTLFGERWLHIVPVVSVLSLGVFFRTAYKCADTLVKSLGAVYQHAFRQALYTTLVLIGSLIGAQLMGLTGVAWAVVLAVAVHYAVITELAVKMTGVRWIEIAQAHVPAAWISSWVAVGLSVLRRIPQFYTIESSLSRLSLELIISCLWALAAYRFGGPLTQGAVVPEMLKRLAVSRSRIAGRLARIGAKASR
jgi:PST family polysaccharide transporter